MKLLCSMIFTVIVLTIALPYVLRDRPGETSDEAKTTLRVGPDGLFESDAIGQSDVEGAMYRWRDGRGTVHLESSPPSDGSAYEVISYRLPPSEGEPGPLAPVDDPRNHNVTPRTSGLADHPLSVYTPEGMERLLQRVDETAKRLQERDRMLDDLGQDL